MSALGQKRTSGYPLQQFIGATSRLGGTVRAPSQF